MAEERLQRRLAAILSTDVVGYSRLMGLDEAGTFFRLNALRQELVDPTIAAYSGRIVKLMGDGTRVEFASAVDAVACAIEIQRSFGSAMPVAPRPIRSSSGSASMSSTSSSRARTSWQASIFRHGSRGLPNRGISISEDTSAAVQQGTGELRRGRRASPKNIARPVRIFRLDKAPKAATASEMRRPMPAQSDKPSIAVLAFNNMSGDPEQEYFSDGISEDIITDLSKLSELHVIARNPTFTYKGKPVDVKQVGRELGVHMFWKAVCARQETASALPASLSTLRAARTCGPNALIATLLISSRCRTSSRGRSFLRSKLS